MSDTYHKITEMITKNAKDLKELMLKIHKNPELALAEFQAVKWQKDFFLDRGFSVESMLFVHRSQCTKMAISEAWNSLSAIGELISSLSSMRKISL